ncbi:unnamed protein product, partial [Rotaria magnacalcarata]
MFLSYALVFFPLISFTYSQTIINVAIIDDNDYPTGVLDIAIPNVTVCDRQGLILRIRWINSSHSLTNVMDQLEF